MEGVLLELEGEAADVHTERRVLLLQDRMEKA